MISLKKLRRLFRRSSYKDNFGLERAIVLPDIWSLFLVQIKPIAFLHVDILLFFFLLLISTPSFSERIKLQYRWKEMNAFRWGDGGGAKEVITALHDSVQEK